MKPNYNARVLACSTELTKKLKAMTAFDLHLICKNEKITTHIISDVHTYHTMGYPVRGHAKEMDSVVAMLITLTTETFLFLYNDDLDLVEYAYAELKERP